MVNQNQIQTWFFGLLFFAAGQIAIFAQAAAQFDLQPVDAPSEKTIAAGGRHDYAVRLAAGEFAQARLDPLGIRLSLAVYDAGGKLILTSESRNGRFGSEIASVIAKEAGVYQFAVIADEARAAGEAAKYKIRLTHRRAANEADARLLETEQIFMRAMRLAERGRPDAWREAIENYKIAAAGLESYGDLYRAAVAYNQLGHTQNLSLARHDSPANYEKALALRRQIGDATGEAITLRFIGNRLASLGELQKALDYLNESIRVARRVGSGEEEIAGLTSLGRVYERSGDFEKALALDREALAKQRALFPAESNVFILVNLGDLHAAVKDWRAALDFYLEADRERQGWASIKSVHTLYRIGTAYARLGNTAKALEFLNQAWEAEQQPRILVRLALITLGLGLTHDALGEREKAIGFFRQSAEFHRQAFMPAGEAAARFQVARVERAAGNLAAARAEIEAALDLVEDIRARLDNQDLRVSYFAAVEEYFDFYVDLLWHMHRENPAAGFAERALEAAERARARSFSELLREAKIEIRQGVAPELLRGEIDLRNEINAKADFRRRMLAARANDADAQRVSIEIKNAIDELAAVQAKIRQASPRRHALSSAPRARVEIADIQTALDDETVLLEYKLGAARSFLWLVTKNSTRIFPLPARAEIEREAKDFYDSISTQTKPDDAKNTAAKKLTEILLAPVAAEIADKRLAIIADGILQFIPFSALVVRSSSSNSTNDGQFLSNEITILPSAGVLTELRRNAGERKTPEKTMAIFADAVFEASDTRLSSRAKNVKPGEKPEDLKAVLRDFNRGEALPRLLSSRFEAKTISAFAPRSEIVVNLDFEASRDNAVNARLSDYQILHFATHGLLDGAHPELSGLVLSLYDKNGEARDGFLRLNQIYNLNLNSDLVVLSACQTALGKDVRGEGLIGLTRGFMAAGARRVVASLWKVDDAATAEFMRRFYQNLLQKKLPAAAALRQAQNEMRQIPRFKSTYFWAAFTVQGDWR